MAKKLRISILFNEPVTDGPKGRKFVAENGQLRDGPDDTSIVKSDGTGSRNMSEKASETIDLSEVGVLGEMEDIKEALDSLGYKTTIINVDSNIARLLQHLTEQRPDIIFNLVECIENESLQEMNVAGLYELLKLPYTGAGPLALGTALNKTRVKEILSYQGIPTPNFQLFKPSDKVVLKEGLTFPLIVKPSHEDGSVGVSDESVVYTYSELRRRVRYVLQEFEQPALVEQYIDGRELNVAILGSRPPVVLPISEIDFSGLTEGMHNIVSYDAKWVDGTIAYVGTKGVCPAPLDPSLEAEIKAIALRCFHLIGCRDYARVDLRLTPDGIPYVLEVNPNPDIAADAGFARSARAYGLTYAEMVGKIVESTLDRWNRR